MATTKKRKARAARRVRKTARPVEVSSESRTGSDKKIRLLASRTLSSLSVVSRQMQGLASRSIRSTALENLGGDDIAKHLAVHGALAALIEKRANPTFLKKGWSGTLSGDYRFTELDFPPFLDLVAASLLPTYHFAHDAKFDRAELTDTLGGLASAVEGVATI